MSHLVVVNSSLRTVKIPTTPTKYLTEVRDEACEKFNVSKEQFTLKYNNKPISLSLQVRLANLPQGARMELVQASRSPSVIMVALQVPVSEGTIVRMVEDFASNTSLWQILRHFESQGSNRNFTQRALPEIDPNGPSGAGRLNYEMPVITIMPSHRVVSDFVGLQQTLTQLGFDSGSVLFRLSYKNSGTPLEEAMAQISQYFKSEEPTVSGAHAASSAQMTSVPDPDSAAPETTATVPDDTEPMDANPIPALASAEPSYRDPSQNPQQLLHGLLNAKPMPPPASEEPKSKNPSQSPQDILLGLLNSKAPRVVTKGPADPVSSVYDTPPGSTRFSRINRNVQFFAPPSSSTPQSAQLAFDATDYEPTVEHAKAHQASLQARTRNQRLLSDKELKDLENVHLEKVNAVAEKGSKVRVRLPDQYQIQFSVDKEDTAEDLYNYMEKFLESHLQGKPFQLKYVGPLGRQVLIVQDKKRLIQDLRFSAAELITFLRDETAGFDTMHGSNTLAKVFQDEAQALKVEEPVVDRNSEPAQPQSKAEGKKVGGSGGDKESKLKAMLNKSLFKR